MKAALQAMVQNELRLRSRRISSLLVLLAAVGLAWLMVADPRSGVAMMVVGRARMVYDSATLAFGSATLTGMLLGLAGFYLSRGRCQEDLRSGCAQVLGATPMSSSLLLLARWLGALLFLVILTLGMMLTVWVLQWTRGEGPVQPLVYLETYTLLLLPVLVFSASLAVLCDAWAPLMGKRGDLLFFGFWMAQFAVLPLTLGQGMRTLNPMFALDISGMSSSLIQLCATLNTEHISVGGGPFDAALPMLNFPADYWSSQLTALRLAAVGVATLPLLPALGLFHRYDPDLVRARPVAQRGFWAGLLARLLAPLTRACARLLPLSARLPGLAGQVVADALLSLILSPLALLLLPAAWLAGLLLPAAQLPALLIAGCAVWGVLISDLPARDAQSGCSELQAALPGGASLRYWRQGLASLLLGLLFCAPALLRWLDPMATAALLAGLLLLSACASLLGQATQGGRSFLMLFLSWLYLATQMPDVRALDLLGFNRAATPLSSGLVLVAAAGLALLGMALQRRRSR